MLQRGRFLFLCLIAGVIGWWVFRVTNNYLLVAIIAGAVVVDSIVRIYLFRSRKKPNRFTRFLRTDTMPKTTTQSEIWKQVALSALLYLFVATGCALIVLTAFETPIIPILMAVTTLLILVPRKYWSLRRYYRPAKVRDGVEAQQRLEFDEDMESIYGSKLLFLGYGALVIIIMTSMGIWLN